MTRWEGEVFGRESEVAFKSLFEWCENILTENNCRWPLNCLNPSYSLLVPIVLTGESARFPTSVFTHFFTQYTCWELTYDLYFKLSYEELLAWFFVRNHSYDALPLCPHLTTAQLNESLLMYERNMEASATISGGRDLSRPVDRKIWRRCKLVYVLQHFWK